MASEQIGETLLPKRLALPVFASDALSSNAYAVQEILVILSLAGFAFYSYAPGIAAAVVVVFAIVVMPGIATLDDLAFLRAFKAIDRVIQDNQPVFMIVWGGYDGSTSLNRGSRYDPATDSWRATSNLCEPYLGAGHFHAHWTGTRLFAWSNADAGGYFYDPATDSWQAIESLGGPPPRSDAASVWTGDRFILWGGQETSGLQDTGFVFRE
mgnify:CR=1 FL=1